jgi:hypothetical protein
MRPSFSLEGLVRKIRLAILKKDVVIAGRCRQCGACCSRVNLDIDGQWIKSRTRFNQMVSDFPDYRRFEIIDTDRDGHLEFACTWLLPDGRCRDHSHRLAICRDFPNKPMFFMNGVLPDGCGFRVQEAVPFDRMLMRELKRRE